MWHCWSVCALLLSERKWLIRSCSYSFLYHTQREYTLMFSYWIRQSDLYAVDITIISRHGEVPLSRPCSSFWPTNKNWPVIVGYGDGLIMITTCNLFLFPGRQWWQVSCQRSLETSCTPSLHILVWAEPLMWFRPPLPPPPPPPPPTHRCCDLRIWRGKAAQGKYVVTGAAWSFCSRLV